jgi:hypothetical protein
MNSKLKSVHKITITDFQSFYYLDEFLYSTQVMSQITPLEVDILFTLCHLLHQRAG